MDQQHQNVSERWIQYQRSNNTTQSWACLDRRIFTKADGLRDHATKTQHDRFPIAKKLMPEIRPKSLPESVLKKSTKDESLPRKTLYDPPVTKSALSEFDMNKIVHNPKLRHDINFDPDLHFPPNLDGEKRRTKKQKAGEVWDTMQSRARPVEAKCIEVDNEQATLASANPGAQPKLNNEQWQALIALHRTLMHEHHDFVFAPQHPSASPTLRKLAADYTILVRMSRHGIHSFLELLRHRLPGSLDHMLAFIYLAFSMMALLYETVSVLKDTWIECLRELGRYRITIEDDNIRDRESWTGVARQWYSKASDKPPTMGRLYHHLAILARPNTLQQLLYYSKLLSITGPSARESILTLYDPVLHPDCGQAQYRLPPLDTAFVKAHGHLLTNKDLARFGFIVLFLGLLEDQIGRATRKFMEQGYHIAVANSVATLGFAKDNILLRAISSPAKDDTDVQVERTLINETSPFFQNAQRLNNSSLEIVLQRIGDPNVLPFIHVTLVFMYRISRHTWTTGVPRAEFPWVLHAIMLNTLLAPCETEGEHELGPGEDPREGLQSCTESKEDRSATCPISSKMNDFELVPPSSSVYFSASADILDSSSGPETSEDQSQFVLADCIYPRTSTLVSGSIIQDSFGALRIIGGKLLRTLKLLDAPLTKLVLVGLIPAVEALSTRNPPVHVEGCEHRWIVHLKNITVRNFEPEFIAECAALLASSLLLLRYDRDRFMFTSASVLGAVYLGSDERVSNFELAPICVSSAGLIIHYHSKRLAPFDKTSAATGTIIGMLAMLLAETSRRIFFPLEGRYKNPWAFHMVADLPAVMIMGWLWEAFVFRLGFAKGFEDAFLERPPRVRDLEGFAVLSDLFSAEEINARYHSMLQEKKQQKGLTRVSADITSLAW